MVRSPLPEDGRITVATLTVAGLEKVRATAPAHVAAVREVLDALGAHGLRELGTASRAVLGHLGVALPDPGRPGS